MDHVIALLVISLLTCSAIAAKDRIDSIVNDEIKKQRIPGISVAVIKDGKIVKSGGYGYANLELKVRATDHTVYQIQSVTKTFTSAAIMMLAEEGKLNIDDKLIKYLPDAPDTWKTITLRHLLTHTSGIKDFINEPVGDLRLELTENLVYEQAKLRKLNFEPGDQYQYSNTNYHLLAMVIRKLTGEYYGDVLRKRIFEPLQMKETRIVTLSSLVPNRASGYVWDKDGEVSNGNFVAESILSYAGGGIMSTVLDLAKWDAALYGNQILSEAAKQASWSQTKLNNGSVSGYGFGWVVNTLSGHRQLAHSGGHVTGFGTILMRFPDDKLTVVVLTNAQWSATDRIALRIAGEYLPGVTQGTAKAIRDKNPEVTVLLRKVLEQGAKGELDLTPFTAKMAKVFTPEVVQQGGARLKQFGKIKKIELLLKAERDGIQNFRYRVIYERSVIYCSLGVDSAGKICGLEFGGS
jgi:CubicO group peptidase (beta-lactamase class C family)